MVLVKRHITRMLLLAEIMVFGWLYLFSPHGMQRVWAVQEKISMVIKKNEEVRSELSEHEKELSLWEKNPFYKEKIAREELQMAHQSEAVYFY